MRKFKDKNGVIYNVSVDSIARVFENSSEYSEITKGKKGEKEEKKSPKTSQNEEKSE